MNDYLPSWPGPYSLLFLDPAKVTDPWEFIKHIDSYTHFIWWGLEDAKVGDHFRLNLDGQPEIQIVKAVQLLGKMFPTQEISHGHKFLITFDCQIYPCPKGSIYYVRI